MGEVLPPHLSPFVDASSRRIGDYIPPEEKKLLGMEDESAAPKKKDSEDEEEEEEDSEEEDESNEEEEEEEEEESEVSGDDVEEMVRIINKEISVFRNSRLRASNFSPTLQRNIPAGFSESDEQDVGGGGQSSGEGGGRQGAGGRGVPAARYDGQEEAQAALQVSVVVYQPIFRS